MQGTLLINIKFEDKWSKRAVNGTKCTRATKPIVQFTMVVFTSKPYLLLK
jgi:hypothetical protein